MALSGKVGAVYRQTTDPAVAFVDEATTADASYTRYQITNPAKRYWDKSQAVTVKKNSVIQSSGFKIEHLSGFVVFDAALLGTDVVTVSGSYLTVSQVGGMFNWSLDVEAETEEVTTFASAGWKEYLPTNIGFSGSAEAYWGDASFFTALGTEVILVFYVDVGASKKRYEGYGVISKDGVEVAHDAVVQESIDFQGSGKLYYREG
ncbi:MAG: hypothetical protein M1598_01980 [Actinobacteria bacterium]|nr:hypothetical protein [Actinomycetota bacterium]